YSRLVRLSARQIQKRPGQQWPGRFSSRLANLLLEADDRLDFHHHTRHRQRRHFDKCRGGLGFTEILLSHRIDYGAVRYVREEYGDLEDILETSTFMLQKLLHSCEDAFSLSDRVVLSHELAVRIKRRNA